MESELFGYDIGSFTGEAGSKQGKFEAANGGTLFLDEIGELEPGDRMEVYLERIEQDLLRSALAINKNNQTRAAQQLGISRSGLTKKVKRPAH